MAVKSKLVSSGGLLVVKVPAGIFGAETIGEMAKYNVNESDGKVHVTFALDGARVVTTFGTGVAAGAGRVYPQTSRGAGLGQSSSFGLNVNEEAQRLGWKVGRDVSIDVQQETNTLIIS